MRAAVGNSLLLYIVIIIASAIMLFFVGALSYTKAYKAKNRIVEIVEKYGTYDDKTDATDAIDEINTALSSMGYTISDVDCPSLYGENQNKTSYGYCIYNMSSQNGYYYKVITYATFDFPVINKLVKIPVYSETKLLGKNYNYN